MTIQKVEDSIVGNRQFMIAIVDDLMNNFKRPLYKPTDTIEEIMHKEGSMKVIDYLNRTYLNG